MDSNTQWLVDFFRAQAQLGFNEGDYTRTRNSCAEVIKLIGNDIESWRLLGEAALASQDSANAVHCFEQLLELQPEQAEHAVQLGKAHVQLKSWDAAALAFRQALAIDPGHSQSEQMLEIVERMRATLTTLGQLPAIQPGRNDPCPCGSGLKYKKCCLAKSTEFAVSERLAEASQAGQWHKVLSLGNELKSKNNHIQRLEALAHYELGHRSLARAALQTLLPSIVRDAPALSALADTYLDVPDLAAAEQFAAQALQVEPGHWRALLVQSACRARQGKLDESESILKSLVAGNPDCRLGWERLGDVLRGQKRAEESVMWFRHWCELRPQSADAWFMLGFQYVLLERDWEDAFQAFETALQLDPQHFEALCWRGACFKERGAFEQAHESMLQGLSIKPDYGAGWNLLGGFYHTYGHQREAEGCYMRAIAIEPSAPFSWNNLANTYLDVREMAEAEKLMRRALHLNARSAPLWNTLGNVLMADKRQMEALDCYKTGLEIDADCVQAKSNYGIGLTNIVKFDEAIANLVEVLDQVPVARSNLLFAVNYHPLLSIEEIYSYYEKYVTRVFPKRRYFEYSNDRSLTRKLKIGYVSPDFRMHACSNFTLPLLSHHDRNNVEVHIYSETRLEDEFTERFKGYADHWLRTVGMPDELLAERIRSDRIDILVDLAGHTGGNRLNVFSLKPAPVQVTWMGFGYTTGIEAIDYYLTDDEAVPEGYDHVFAEKPWRMACPSYAYAAPATPDVSPLPASSKGYITFGTLSRSIRLNSDVIRVWSEILKQVANSRLIMNSGAFADQGMCDFYADMFAGFGIERERLEMGFDSPPWSVLADMDIGLDCFPHNSGTTLFESLWQGVPFVSLRNRPSMGRLGASILRAVGREEWIADSEQVYIEKAVALAQDKDELARIRAGLRDEMLASPVCDANYFARRLEQDYRKMWQLFCEEQA